MFLPDRIRREVGLSAVGEDKAGKRRPRIFISIATVVKQLDLTLPKTLSGKPRYRRRDFLSDVRNSVGLSAAFDRSSSSGEAASSRCSSKPAKVDIRIFVRGRT